MKNIKKVSAMLMATVMTAGAVSSMTAGARIYGYSKDEMDDIIEDAYMLPIDGFLSKTDNNVYRHERTYLVETEEDNLFHFYELGGQTPDSISAVVDADIDCDAIGEAIDEICPDAEYVRITQPVGAYVASSRYIGIAGFFQYPDPYRPYEETRKNDLTYDQVLEIYEILKSTGKLQSFKYERTSVAIGETGRYLTGYNTVSSMDGKTNYKELIENYIAENNLDWYIEEDSDDEFHVTTGQRLSAEENYKIAEQIYNDLGIYPLIIYPESASLSEDITIEMHDKIDGDANNDGELTLADAIVTLQSVGNPEKYGVNGWDDTHITYQGSFNADITGDYDGITSADALAIQRKVLGLE